MDTLIKLGATSPEDLAKALTLVQAINVLPGALPVPAGPGAGAAGTSRGQALQQAAAAEAKEQCDNISRASSVSSSGSINSVACSTISLSSDDVDVVPRAQAGRVRITPADMCVSAATMAAIKKAEACPNASQPLTWKDARTLSPLSIYIYVCIRICLYIHMYVYI